MQKKSIIKESGVIESIPSIKSINKHDLTDREQKIKDTIEKSFKDFTLESIQTPADSMYYNLNISTTIDDLNKDDLELQRFKISQLFSKLRLNLFEELSKVLSVVNIKTGPYSFSKNDDKITFAITILLSDTEIKDWVSGRRIKDKNKKEKKFMENKNYKMNTKKILTNIYIDSKRNKKNNINLNEAGSVLKNIHYKLLLNEARKKESEDGENNNNKKKSKKINTRSEELEQKFGKTKLDTLDTLIKGYKELADEIERKTVEFTKSIEKDDKLKETYFVRVEKMLNQMKITEYVIDDIVAKITQRQSRSGNTKWKSIVEEALEKLNEEGKKILTDLKEKYTEYPVYPPQLNIEAKINRKKINKLIEMIEKQSGKKIYILESIVSKIKSLLMSIKNYTSLVMSTRRKLTNLYNEL